MRKTYVLDTNVLIQAPYALMCFEDNDIIMPVTVLEELDGLKYADGERGANARHAIRFLEQLREKGNLTEGVALPLGGNFRLETNHANVELPEGFLKEKNDNRILKVCKGIMNDENLDVIQAKGIISRAGKGTKVILLGDPNQIDNPLLDERTNGLSYASEKMKNSPFCYQVTLFPEECERSELAMDAIKRMQ